MFKFIKQQYSKRPILTSIIGLIMLVILYFILRGIFKKVKNQQDLNQLQDLENQFPNFSAVNVATAVYEALSDNIFIGDWENEQAAMAAIQSLTKPQLSLVSKAFRIKYGESMFDYMIDQMEDETYKTMLYQLFTGIN